LGNFLGRKYHKKNEAPHDETLRGNSWFMLQKKSLACLLFIQTIWSPTGQKDY